MIARFHLPRGQRFYEDAIEGLVRVNERLYRENPSLPSVLASGVRYLGLDPGEDWRNAAEVIESGKGDCEDLAAARAGELRARGEHGASAIVVRTGPKMTHAQVRRADGTIEDPSRLLGMGSNDERMGGTMSRYPGFDDAVGARATRARRKVVKLNPAQMRAIKVSARRATQAVNDSVVVVPSTPGATGPYSSAPADPYTLPGAPAQFDDSPDPYQQTSNDDYEYDPYEPDYESDYGRDADDDWEVLSGTPTTEIKWAANKTPTGWQGLITVPLIDGRSLVVSRTADTKPAATNKAISAAGKVLDSPLAKMLIPPQAQAALRVLQSPTAQKAAMVAFNAAKKMKFW